VGEEEGRGGLAEEEEEEEVVFDVCWRLSLDNICL
jgi:hypothetical protein